MGLFLLELFLLLLCLFSLLLVLLFLEPEFLFPALFHVLDHLLAHLKLSLDVHALVEEGVIAVKYIGSSLYLGALHEEEGVIAFKYFRSSRTDHGSLHDLLLESLILLSELPD